MCACWTSRQARCDGLMGGRVKGFRPLTGQSRTTPAPRPVKNSAGRWAGVVDKESSHRGEVARRRLTRSYKRAVLVHTPVHASWLNRVEVYLANAAEGTHPERLRRLGGRRTPLVVVRGVVQPLAEAIR